MSGAPQQSGSCAEAITGNKKVAHETANTCSLILMSTYPTPYQEEPLCTCRRPFATADFGSKTVQNKQRQILPDLRKHSHISLFFLIFTYT